MASMAFKTFIVLGFPVEVRLGGGRILSDTSGCDAAMAQPTYRAQETSQPLNLRSCGYGTEVVKKFWSWLKSAGRREEVKFLTLDLLFPFLYEGALAVSLWWIWVMVGCAFHPAWIVAPLAMILTTDWTENLIQLAQLRQYVASNEGRIQSFWIQASSCATIIKLWLTSGLYVSLVGFAVRMIFTLSDRRLANAAE